MIKGVRAGGLKSILPSTSALPLLLAPSFSPPAGDATTPAQAGGPRGGSGRRIRGSCTVGEGGWCVEQRAHPVATSAAIDSSPTNPARAHGGCRPPLPDQGTGAHRPALAPSRWRVKNALRLLTLLDYYDPKKLHSLHGGSELTTTLYQTTGDASGDMGHVNITSLCGGKVGFASAQPGAKFQATYTKSVKEEPYNLSVLEVSDPITFPGLFTSPSAASSNLTALLEKAGCKRFTALIVSSGVIKTYQAAMDKGLTLFAPNDDAFYAKGLPDLNKLTAADLVSLLEYHALPQYAPKASLKTIKGGIPTLASTGKGKYDLSVDSKGDDVSMDTGMDKSRVASTLLDDAPVAVHTVDSVLLPRELFGGAPSPAPAPTGAAADTPASSPAPATPALAPAPKHEKKKPKKGKSHSPPAPPADSPADAPEGDEADKSGATDVGMSYAAMVASVAALVGASLL